MSDPIIDAIQRKMMLRAAQAERLHKLRDEVLRELAEIDGLDVEQLTQAVDADVIKLPDPPVARPVEAVQAPAELPAADQGSPQADGRLVAAERRMAEIAQRILAYVEEHPDRNGADIFVELGLSLSNSARSRHLGRLVESGKLVYRHAGPKGRLYRVAGDDSPPAAASVRESVRREGAADRVDRKAVEKASDERNRRILHAVRETGAVGTRAVELAERLQMSVATVRGVLRHFTQAGHLVSVEDDGKGALYRAADIGMLPADEDGAKTGPERKVVDHLRQAKGPRPASEISTETGLSIADVGPICNGLVRRGVLLGLPPKRDGLPRRFSLAEAA